ncbi:Cupredoxin [Kockiozyma suomiensis]|uniref:Cupredoxin n=1 Tax=Kockiozyma suomiensis TaxID=1337062 RepID=UPI00334437B7
MFRSPVSRIHSVIVVLLSLTKAVSAKVVDYNLTLTPAYRAPDGVYRETFLVNGQSPGPLIVCDEGDYLNILVRNELLIPITMHWHGIRQKGTPWLDGAAGVTQEAIAPHRSFRYNFSTEDQYGNFWYHSHIRAHYQDGLYGAIYIRPKADRPKPYNSITNDSVALDEILEREENPVIVSVSDWYKWTSEAIMLRQEYYGIDPPCLQSLLVNGKGRIVCHSADEIAQAGQSKLKEFTAGTKTDSYFDSQGCLNLKKNGFEGVNLTALEAPGFSAQCQPTFTDREIIYVNNSQWMVFSITNMGGSMSHYFSIDSHSFTVVMVEGTYIKPQTVERLFLGIGNRFLIVVKTNKQSGVYAMRFAGAEVAQVIEGFALLSYDANTTAEQLEGPTENAEPYMDIGGNLKLKNLLTFNSASAAPFDDLKPPQGAADRTIRLLSNRTGVVSFSLMPNGAQLSESLEHSMPLLWTTDKFPEGSIVIDQGIKTGDLVDIILNNARAVSHPMHLHGHNFWVISEDLDHNFEYETVKAAMAENHSTLNFENPPFRDGYTVNRAGHIVLRFIADNPGAWMFHCHINSHVIGGMAIVIIEDRERALGLMPDFAKGLV